MIKCIWWNDAWSMNHESTLLWLMVRSGSRTEPGAHRTGIECWSWITIWSVKAAWRGTHAWGTITKVYWKFEIDGKGTKVKAQTVKGTTARHWIELAMSRSIIYSIIRNSYFILKYWALHVHVHKSTRESRRPTRVVTSLSHRWKLYGTVRAGRGTVVSIAHLCRYRVESFLSDLAYLSIYINKL